MIFSRNKNFSSPVASEYNPSVYTVLAPISFHIKAMDTILIHTGVKLCIKNCKTISQRGHVAFYFNIENNPYVKSSSKVDILEFFERKELQITIVNTSLQDYHIKAGTVIGKVFIVDLNTPEPSTMD